MRQYGGVTVHEASGWGVVVPVKGLASAKSRLSTRSAGQRRELVLAFALDVVQACREAAGVVEVLVVSPDAAVRERVAELGASTLDDIEDTGLVHALEAGVASLRDGTGRRDVLMLAADLPALRASDVELVLALAAQHPRSFVADVAGTGTTALAVRGTTRPDPRFGPRSRAAHRASGATELTDERLVRVRADVDTEVDLWHARALGPGPRTSAFLDAYGG